MFYGELKDSEANLIDNVLMLTFVGPNSFTGENVVEFQCHGSVSVVSSVENALLSAGAFQAEAGEFSYRAFLNGKMSFGAVEQLGDVFRARDQADLQLVYRRRDGSMEAFVSSLRERLLQVQAILDTAVDFVDEYSEVLEQVKAPITQVIHESSMAIQRFSHLKDASHSPRLVLAGAPNAGKSSLFNAMLGRYRTIVHDSPGTTRDVVEELVEIGSRRWRIVDTAGFRDQTEGAELQGLELGEGFLGSAEAWLLVVDGAVGMGDADRRLLATFGHKPHRVIWNKVDADRWIEPPEDIEGQVIRISAKTGQNLELFWQTIRDLLSKSELPGYIPLPSMSQTEKLQIVVEDLGNMLRDLSAIGVPEVLAEQNRQILGKIESIIGPVDNEDVLDRVFGDFCIGK